MIINERDIRHAHVLEVAKQIMTAARTAPKAKGIDIVETICITGEEIKKLSEKMQDIAREKDYKFFLRDAENILKAEVIILIGTRVQEQGLDCGHCGFPTCNSKPKATPCAINSVDVGIAIGSACSAAADHRIDSRVMFSAGLAAQRLGWPESCQTVFAIPLSASSKNPFFDRK